MNEELKSLLEKMDVPKLRIEWNDIGWFLRNLAIRNSNHPDFAKAIELLKEERNKL